jgi:hypothetical protein
VGDRQRLRYRLLPFLASVRDRSLCDDANGTVSTVSGTVSGCSAIVSHGGNVVIDNTTNGTFSQTLP